MKSVLLAAGRGRRLGDLTNNRPKCMVELSAKPLIHWQISALSAAGIEDIAVVRGYLGESIDAPKATFIENKDWQTTNMVTSLYKARHWIGDQPVVVSYTDIVYGPDPVRRLMSANNDIAITYDTDWFDLWSKRFADPLSDAETFCLGSNNTISGIGQKPSNLGQIEGQYMGLLHFSKVGWHECLKYLDSLTELDRKAMDMTSMLRELISDGQKIHGVPVHGNWAEIDSESDLILCNSMLKSGKLQLIV